MTPKEQAKMRQEVKDMPPAELVEAHSRAISLVEMIWGETEKRLCGAREGDACPRAIASAKAGAMKHDATRFHRMADALAGEFGALLPGGSAVPVARSGSR